MPLIQTDGEDQCMLPVYDEQEGATFANDLGTPHNNWADHMLQQEEVKVLFACTSSVMVSESEDLEHSGSLNSGSLKQTRDSPVALSKSGGTVQCGDQRLREEELQVAVLERTVQLQASELAELHGAGHFSGDGPEGGSNWARWGAALLAEGGKGNNSPLVGMSNRAELVADLQQTVDRQATDLSRLEHQNQMLEAHAQDFSELHEALGMCQHASHMLERQAEESAEVRETLELESVALDAYHGEKQRWEAQEQELFRLKEVFEVQTAELDSLRRRNGRLEVEGQELLQLRETLNALREESERLELHEQQVADLHETLHTLQQDNRKLQAEAATVEGLRQDGEQMQAQQEEISKLLGEARQKALECERLHWENRRLKEVEKELVRLRGALLHEKDSVAARDREIAHLRAVLDEQSAAGPALARATEEQLAQLHLQEEQLATLQGVCEAEAATLFGRQRGLILEAEMSHAQRCRKDSDIGELMDGVVSREVLPWRAEHVQLLEAEVATLRGALQEHRAEEAQERACADCARQEVERTTTSEEQLFLDSQRDALAEQEISGLSVIHDALEAQTLSTESFTIERNRRLSHEQELSELRSASEVQATLIRKLREENARLEMQEKEIGKLRNALDLQTTNVDTLLRESQRLQALEAELAGLRADQERSRLSMRHASCATEESWSLFNSPGTTGPDGSASASAAAKLAKVGSGCDAAVLTASGGSNSGGIAAAWLPELPQSWAQIDEPWRLVHAILGLLDATQQRLASSGTVASQPQNCVRWQSLLSVDIRILVGVGAA
eukprot:CAMPEP_0172801356 /NCGR_PEP_ID=MMETSP1075-20121228/3144_1 /TAXON_ID=2916 /ORGANISM="Ceratium fusus, Strain PA161109" /LENGTH=792 /DNA_ID=CAMNT_0013639399 /DNA_START=141 /DNA_END=2515 /DNA_ORIENTATION=+